MTLVKFKEISVGERFFYRGDEFVKCELSQFKSSFAVVKTDGTDVNLMSHMRSLQKNSNAFTIRGLTEDKNKFAFFEDEVTISIKE